MKVKNSPKVKMTMEVIKKPSLTLRLIESIKKAFREM